MCGHARKDRIRNEVICDSVGAAPTKEKLVQHQLRWFGHIQWRPLEAPVNSGILKAKENTRRGGRQSKLTWEEAIKRARGIGNLALDRTAWKSAIHVLE